MRIDNDMPLIRAMSAMAANMTCDGRARLKMGRSLEKYMKTAPARIAEAAARSDSEDLQRLAASARPMEACAREMQGLHTPRLPADGGRTRIEHIAAKIISGGDRAASFEDMLLSLSAFDEIQGLTMAEYWAAPDALRKALCRAWADTAESVLRAARERIKAEEWVYSGGGGEVFARSSAFCERALQLAMELERPEIRLHVENALARVDSSADAAVRHAHEAVSLNILRLENIAAARRMLEKCDWQTAFEETSRTEKLLREDPSGTYPRMDEKSRAALRDELAHIASRISMGEGAVARCAAHAAGEFSENDVRHCLCWWLYDDAGRKALLNRLGARRKIRPMFPDPKGRGYMAVSIALTLIITVFCAKITGRIWPVIFIWPLARRLSGYVIARAVTRMVRPKYLLRMDYAALPDDRRTLVVIPALIPSPARARELCRQLEILGCLEKDENLDFLLLGDFSDANEHIMPGDADMLAAAREEISAMNARADREKYHYLHRARRYAARDGIYRGHARKRGALMALGRLMTGENTDEFSAECACADKIAGRFRYVVTLDADTAMLPGTARELIACMAHPINERRENRGFAVLQPCVETNPAAPATVFSRLFAGVGGLSAYSGLISEMVYDLTGAGSFCGKGAIDMPAFMASLEGKLDDDRILSHDLIEGILARTGRISDIALFDGFPTTYPKFSARLSRWTRGDWQLLPEIFRPEISLMDRFRMAANLTDSLHDAALLTLFLLSAWTQNRGGFALAAIFALIEPVISRLMGDENAFRRGCMQLTLLPAAAYMRIDAIVRALYRQFVSGKNLLDWVTSADASGDMKITRAACRAGAILFVPALLAPGWIFPAAALILLFLIGPGWARETGEERVEKSINLSDGDRKMLTDLARDTWRFFDTYVTSETNFLPPDNVQLDPPAPPAPRTSPTNIAMYMLSCLSAEKLGFIPRDEAAARISDTLATLENLEKWRGHLYNWYDIHTAAPLEPRYVSSVDSGNLAAALMLCAHEFRDENLGRRLMALAENTDLAALYDDRKKLFHIGLDARRSELSKSHYDLLASESRILSFAAMMLGQTDVKNWRALGRPASEGTLISWSGTMFEYLMPAIFMPSAPGTLLDCAMDGAVRTQIAFGRGMNRPWGVSESGYHAFDMELNYQYRAFGMRSLSLEGRVPQHVAAPYASCLALTARPAAAVRNIRRMLDLGWAGECGLFEASDYTHEEPALVKSWMAHHQGMALCAVCNCLTENGLQKIFMDIPEARALELLLNERPAPRIKLRPVPSRSALAASRRRPDFSRRGRPDTRLADTFITGAAGATALITARGDVQYARRAVHAARFAGDFLCRRDSMDTYAENILTGEKIRINSPDAQSVFTPGRAKFSARMGNVDLEMQLGISPMTGALTKRIRLENTGDSPMPVRITDAFEPMLMTAAEMRAHPAFFRLFLTSDLSRENAIVFRRTPRSSSETHMTLFHVMAGASCRRETVWTEGRNAIAEPVSHDGPALDAGSILSADIPLKPGEICTISLAVGLCEEEKLTENLENHSDAAYAAGQLRLAAATARSAAEFAGLDDEKRSLIERACAFIADPRLALRTGAGETERPAGIFWDEPCVCLFMDGSESISVLRDVIRMHEYTRAMGLRWQLAIVDDESRGYNRPMRDNIDDVINAGHLAHLRGQPGGVQIFDGNSMPNSQRKNLMRSSCIVLDGSAPLWNQLRRILMALECAPGGQYGEMRGPKKSADPEFLDRERFSFSISPEHLPPVPWSNIITGENLGMLITERGGGFIWHKNSRLRRVTCFDNDPSREGWSAMLYVSDLRRASFARALPGEKPMGMWRVRHALWGSTFETEADKLHITTRVFHAESPEALRFMLTVENLDASPREIALTAFMDWLMGEDSSDAARIRAWNRNGALFAAGGIPGAAYMASDALDARCGPDRNSFLGHGGIMRPDGLFADAEKSGGHVLRVKRLLDAGGACTVTFAVGAENDIPSAEKSAQKIREESASAALASAKAGWAAIQEKFSLKTGDETLDNLANGFLVKQTLDARVRARAGFYQAGGAYGFRDQLQDVIALLPYDPARARSHILRCAAHQFQSGDVMHWWHEPASGVRTRITDDLLFLPWAAAEYAEYTGDSGIFAENIEYLADENIPDGHDDWYGPARPSGESESLLRHCLRAIDRAWQCGEHGLLLMGGGDWNDGMNRVGDKGRGESVWLTMFFAFVCEKFAAFASESDRKNLLDMASQARAAVENSGWDGQWYLRAYDDDGSPIGAEGNPHCEIDLISQAWAVISQMDETRARRAMESAHEKLIDRENRIIKLLTPPFTKDAEADPGYIAAYPPGVRENGGQYTHAACWYLLALSMLGDAPRAKEALAMLMPTGRGENYRAEPYVLAADVYGEPPYAGRAGWTWYTGSAGWFLTALRHLAGFEKQGDKVRLNALSGMWENPSVTLKHGSAEYTLISDKNTHAVTLDGIPVDGDWITLADDGRNHTVIFPQR